MLNPVKLTDLTAGDIVTVVNGRHSGLSEDSYLVRASDVEGADGLYVLDRFGAKRFLAGCTDLDNNELVGFAVNPLNAVEAEIAKRWPSDVDTSLPIADSAEEETEIKWAEQGALYDAVMRQSASRLAVATLRAATAREASYRQETDERDGGYELTIEQAVRKFVPDPYESCILTLALELGWNDALSAACSTLGWDETTDWAVLLDKDYPL